MLFVNVLSYVRTVVLQERGHVADLCAPLLRGVNLQQILDYVVRRSVLIVGAKMRQGGDPAAVSTSHHHKKIQQLPGQQVVSIINNKQS